jgi:YbgC/YbaW family acyl-CoA thioester hydrolase
MVEVKTPMKVPGEYIDAYGHVNYLSLPKIFERGQDAFMASHGLSFDDLQDRYGLRSFVRRMEVDYRGQLFEGDDIVVNTTLGLGTSSLTYDQSVNKNDEVIASSKLVVVLVDSEGRKTVIPDDVRKRLG